MKDFMISTDDRDIRKGDKNFSPFGDASAVLESIEDDGDFVVLKYTGGLTINIPESRITYIATLA